LPDPIHIVCLDAPSPPDYGGAIDMYYKVKELSRLHDIFLHYFNYKPQRDASGLHGYCREIFSYGRKSFSSSLPLRKPYIIGSRINNLLIEKLNADNYPVLLEGIHLAGIIPYLNSNRKIVIRMHNDEAEYYKRLSAAEKNPLRKIYHWNESRLLKKFQLQLSENIPLACVSHSDMDALKNKYGKSRLYYVPSFTPWQECNSEAGRGEYCLYHGNMEVAENKAMALWLMNQVFVDTDIKFKIAGKSAGLIRAEQKHSHIEIINDPSTEQMEALIRHAQINVVPSLNNTGLKLKLLHALKSGRHCITNEAGVAGTGLEKLVTIAHDVTSFREAIKMMMPQPFSAAIGSQRQKLMEDYSNKKNAAILSALLY
jgi:glycosyltransferase involved in cell wall biosynthesis